MIFKDLDALLTRVVRHWMLVLLTLLVVINVVAWQQIPGPARWNSLWCMAGQGGNDCAARLASGVRYRASAQLVVVPSPGLALTDVPRIVALLNNNVVIATCVDVLESPVVITRVLEQVGLPAGEWQRYSVRVLQQPDSNVLRLTVEGPDRAVTEQLASTMQTRGREYLTELFPLYTLMTLEAQPSRASVVASNWQIRIVLAAVVGLGLGVLIALWYDVVVTARRTNRARAMASMAQPRDTRVLSRISLDQ